MSLTVLSISMSKLVLICKGVFIRLYPRLLNSVKVLWIKLLCALVTGFKRLPSQYLFSSLCLQVHLQLARIVYALWHDWSSLLLKLDLDEF